jgi:hypothetical protein
VQSPWRPACCRRGMADFEQCEMRRLPRLPRGRPRHRSKWPQAALMRSQAARARASRRARRAVQAMFGGVLAPLRGAEKPDRLLGEFTEQLVVNLEDLVSRFADIFRLGIPCLSWAVRRRDLRPRCLHRLGHVRCRRLFDFGRFAFHARKLRLTGGVVNGRLPRIRTASMEIAGPL